MVICPFQIPSHAILVSYFYKSKQSYVLVLLPGQTSQKLPKDRKNLEPHTEENLYPFQVVIKDDQPCPFR